ncbi:MAG: hypothetical protein LBK40_01540 [Spirochaetaceae bacterium]|jgi:hypothetical protein|nr:hypothetical protein [Spirochaetaceae bacterium]
MKRRFLCAVLLGLIILPLSALELSVTGGLGNLRFDPDRDSSLGAAGEQFSPLLYLPINAVFSDQAVDRFSYTVEFKRGPVLRNQLSAVLGIDFEYGSLAFGPVFGLWNDAGDFIKPGVLLRAGLELPGKAFILLEGNATIGALTAEGDYAEEYGRAAFGIWVPYAVITLSAAREEFSSMNGSGVLIQDRRIRYGFSAAAFKKNVPYTVDLNLGYQILEREYVHAGTDNLKSLYLGCEFRASIRPTLTFVLGGEMPLYTWGKDPLKSPSRSTPLYEVRTGFIWTMGE